MGSKCIKEGENVKCTYINRDAILAGMLQIEANTSVVQSNFKPDKSYKT